MTAALTTTNLTKKFGTHAALRGINLSISSGVTGLLGPNGAGKTTLLKILATVLSSTSGEARVLGFDPRVAKERTEIRRRLGYLPQDPGMYAGFSAFDMVDYVAVLKEHSDRRIRHDEVRRVLEQVGLTDEMHRKIRRLSGGMRRRVALATALLGRPELLILDEPAAGLDPEQRLRFRQSISEAARAHTVIVSTHQTEEVAAMCQQVIVLRGGGVQFEGTPADLAHIAAGQVWHSDSQTSGAIRSWLTGDGVYRQIGTPPDGATLVDPTIEDGYLLLTCAQDAVRP